MAFTSVVVLSCLVPWVVQAKTEVTVLYETLCPYCKRLFANKIRPIVETTGWEDDISFLLYPYGNAGSMDRCQHGPVECEGNKIHACAIEALGQGSPQAVRYVACMEAAMQEQRASPAQAAEICSPSEAASYIACSNDDAKVGPLMEIAAQETRSITKAVAAAGGGFVVPWATLPDNPTWSITGGFLNQLCSEVPDSVICTACSEAQGFVTCDAHRRLMELTKPVLV